MAAAALVMGKSLFGRRSGCALTASAFQPSICPAGQILSKRRALGFNTSLFSSTQQQDDITAAGSTTKEVAPATVATPWNDPRVEARIKTRRRNNNNRFRQHVNPLSRVYQQPTELSEEWPMDVFDSVENIPLHVDIGCGKGGFLLDYVASEFATRERYNYLGLEIRPMVAQFAKERVSIHGLTGKLDFLGCNANVDFDRLLERYQSHATAEKSEDDDGASLLLKRVSIQYPDPHFKKQHAKRRVVTAELVDTVAKFMPPSEGVVFLQSDVQGVLDDMRDRFAEASMYFTAHKQHDMDIYLPDNPLGVPTEREVSVLEKDLPVYRVLFQRTGTPYQPNQIRRTKPPR